MKRVSMFALFSVLFLLASAVFSGCGRSFGHSPMGPAGLGTATPTPSPYIPALNLTVSETPTDTPTITWTTTETPQPPMPTPTSCQSKTWCGEAPNGNGIAFNACIWEYYRFQPSSCISAFELLIDQAIELTAAITLTTPFGDIPVTYNGTGYEAASQVIYQPGGIYTITAITSLGTVSSTMQAPGGNEHLSPDGLLGYYDFDGNRDYFIGPGTVSVSGGVTYLSGGYMSGLYTSDVDSPFTIPPGTYIPPGMVCVQISAQTINYIVGAVPWSNFTMKREVLACYTKP